MEFKKIKPHPDETYEIAYDDDCLVIRVGARELYISKSMANWIAFNFADKGKTKHFVKHLPKEPELTPAQIKNRTPVLEL